jgi:hypothetical protein
MAYCGRLFDTVSYVFWALSRNKSSIELPALKFAPEGPADIHGLNSTIACVVQRPIAQIQILPARRQPSDSGSLLPTIRGEYQY